MQVTLKINGREEVFSNVEEIISIKEEYPSYPLEGKKDPEPEVERSYLVDPKSINRKLFSKELSDSKQEEVRQLILEAFSMTRKEPERYNKAFKNVVPEKNWIGSKDVQDLINVAYGMNGCLATWVELALEWAQRISNGESWESICNISDENPYYRLVEWKDKTIRSIGGSHNTFDMSPTAKIGEEQHSVEEHVLFAVPLVSIKSDI